MTTAPADTNAAATYTLDTQPCSRCGGCGQYSYNEVHGTTCYGCAGTGKNYTKKAKAVLAKLAAHLESIGLQRARGKALMFESTIARGGIIVGRFVSDGKFYREVVSVDVDKSQGMGWSGKEACDNPTAENASSWRAVVTFADGSTMTTSSNGIHRCRLTVAEAAARRAIFAAHVGKGVSIAAPTT